MDHQQGLPVKYLREIAKAACLAGLLGACTESPSGRASPWRDAAAAGDARGEFEEEASSSDQKDGGVVDALVGDQVDDAGGVQGSPPAEPVPRGAGESCAPAAAKVTVNSMLEEMTDLGVLARRSPVKFTTHEASSYDRRSVTPTASAAAPEGWYANTDWGNYLRVEETSRGAEHVMMETEGPGALVRIWTANGQEGTLRIYLDDMVIPAITADFVALLSGQVPPFTEPFSVVNSTGRNFDFPLPFRARAKVTITGSAKIPASAYFYQVFFRQYASCADVETFRQEDISAAALEAARSGLTSGGAAGAGQLAVAEVQLDGTRSTFVVPAAPGGSEIAELLIKPGALDPVSLRETTLSLAFDGQQTVLAPLGDFFGAGPGLVAHRTLPLEVKADGTMIARFVMPFATDAKITLGLSRAQTALVQLRHRARRFGPDSFHFFAHWTARGPIPSRPFRDLLLADVAGEGAFVGTVLSHDDLSSEWWGEGDEKITVDGEAFPSLFGTGTEDYFGYAYSTRAPFDHAFRMLRPTGPHRGQLTSARFHVLDVIRFESSLRFDLEEWHWDPTASVYFDTLVYFYARPDAIDKMALAVPADFRVVSRPLGAAVVPAR
jgi:hypothetical protein